MICRLQRLTKSLQNTCPVISIHGNSYCLNGASAGSGMLAALVLETAEVSERIPQTEVCFWPLLCSPDDDQTWACTCVLQPKEQLPKH